MFSSGFFLLPGIAAAETGPSVFLAYLVSGLLVLPTMFSVAELATAMPKAGGTYYIIDRSFRACYWHDRRLWLLAGTGA
ncbi:MAG: amino acid permease [Fodinibius sp.]|nr:amino acid permease [Fodinibius sp.]